MMALTQGTTQLLFLLVTISVFWSLCCAMKQCYVCSGKFPDRDCELYPQYVTSGPGKINCTRNFCSTIARYKPKKHMYTMNNDGEIIATKRPLTPADFDVDSIARECEDYERGNSCLMDSLNLAITCNSICDTELCNEDVPSPEKYGVSTIATSPTTTTTTTTTYYTPEYTAPKKFDPSAGDYMDKGDSSKFNERDIMYGDPSNYDYKDERVPDGYEMDDYKYEPTPQTNATEANEMGDKEDQYKDMDLDSAAGAIYCDFRHIAASVALILISQF